MDKMERKTRPENQRITPSKQHCRTVTDELTTDRRRNRLKYIQRQKQLNINTVRGIKHDAVGEKLQNKTGNISSKIPNCNRNKETGYT